MRWQPGKTEAHEADRERLSALFKSVDCIVNLAGENVGKKRWSQAVKDQILSSRIRSIELLGEALHLSGNKEATFLQTSKVRLSDPMEARSLIFIPLKASRDHGSEAILIC